MNKVRAWLSTVSHKGRTEIYSPYNIEIEISEKDIELLNSHSNDTLEVDGKLKTKKEDYRELFIMGSKSIRQHFKIINIEIIDEDHLKVKLKLSQYIGK